MWNVKTLVIGDCSDQGVPPSLLSSSSGGNINRDFSREKTRGLLFSCYVVATAKGQ